MGNSSRKKDRPEPRIRKDNWLLENLKRRNDTKPDSKLISVRNYHLLYGRKLPTHPLPTPASSTEQL